MPHVILLGDSIFDNAAYVRGGPDVVRQLRDRVPAGWEATLLARDGAVVSSVRTQVQHLPEGATHLVMSAGGNDGLANIDVLYRSVGSVAEAMVRLADLVGEFEAEYRRTLAAVLERGLPTAVCTVYNPRFPDPQEQRVAVAGLAHWNDAILRAAFEAGVPVIELRLVCDEDADFASPIEPSVQGGDKISDAILRLVQEHDFASGRTAVFV